MFLTGLNSTPPLKYLLVRFTIEASKALSFRDFVKSEAIFFTPLFAPVEADPPIADAAVDDGPSIPALAAPY